MTHAKTILLSTSPDNSEMEELVFSLGYEMEETLIQSRQRPHPDTFLGRGKVEEAIERVRETDAGLVVINGNLKPGQIFNLHRMFNAGNDAGDREIQVYDRVRLILEIFSERAHSQEARLQVELAKLRYEMPLVKEAIHLAKKGERPGFLGGGEYEVDQYYERMKRRMAAIRKELSKTSRERQVRRKHRRRGGFHLVSLAGYTNAGKSSLLTALADEDTLVEDRYFSTLGTKTRRVMSDRREILATDTVGFIENLPPWVVEAFHSTLEEIALADVVLLVVDASDPVPELRRRLRTSLQTLYEFDADSDNGRKGAPLTSRTNHGADEDERGLAPIVTVFNKVDLLPPAELEATMRTLVEEGYVPGPAVAVSAKNGLGIGELYDTIYAELPDYDEYEVAIPQSPEGESFLAWIHEHGDVLDLTRGNEVHVHFEAKGELRAPIVEKLQETGAIPLEDARRGMKPRRVEQESEGAPSPDAARVHDMPMEEAWAAYRKG